MDEGYLRHLIERMPSRYLVANERTVQVGQRTIEQRDVISWYSDALKVGGTRQTVLLRTREEIGYPTAWFKYPLAVEDISHRATLVGWWYK